MQLENGRQELPMLQPQHLKSLPNAVMPIDGLTLGKVKGMALMLFFHHKAPLRQASLS